MSEDELLVFGISFALTLWGWLTWYISIINFWHGERGRLSRAWLKILPLVCVAGIYSVLRNLASFDVVTDGQYVFFYLLLGLAWLAMGRAMLFTFYDISWRDDALERNNLAAVFFISGALLGLTAIYAGANVGDGPGWWCVVGAGGIASITWLILIQFFQIVSKISERITIERDVGAGLRIGFYLFASGLVLGRGAAGDWTSLSQTFIEFLDAWPVLILTLLALVVEWRYSRMESATPTYGQWAYVALMWGLVYLLIAIFILMLFPPFPENPMYALTISPMEEVGRLL